jgi:hypothetical protein
VEKSEQVGDEKRKGNAKEKYEKVKKKVKWKVKG